jgi:DNA sulfur modification protein DndB
MVSGISGTLCVTDEELRKAASKRKKSFLSQSVKNEQVNELKLKGWEIYGRPSKNKTKMRKAKNMADAFEDRVWMIFYNLGFSHMNKDRKCKLQFDTYEKQVDVLAKDGENIFVVECRSSAIEGPYNAKEQLEEYVGKRDEIQKAIESVWGRGCGRINIVIAISSTDKRVEDENYVKERKDKNIYLWSANDIGYIESLIQQVGASAKYQLYSVIFVNKKNKSLVKELPAIKGKIGKNTFYTFIISAKQLLKYAYVHHRDLTGVVEASQVYQRMLRSAKLKEIAKFIDVEGGYFPNSIIVNFSKPTQLVSEKKCDDNVSICQIKLPEYYGSAWIIDGQHRLYGAAKAERDVLVPVLAFINMETLEQANLFVEINEKQTSVPKNHLWDLYSDIYRESKDEKQKILFQIAETAKRLENFGALKGLIDIPSIPADRPVKLSLTTICSTVEKYSPWDLLKHQSDEDKTPDNAARLINLYFGILKSLWPEDWAKGNKGVLLTNNGFGVFMMVFNDILNHLAYKQKKYLLQASRAKELESLLKDKYLTPLVEYLKTDSRMQSDIRTKTGRGPQNDNAGVLDLKIQEFIPDYSPPRMKEPPPPPIVKEPPAISGIEEAARLAEPHLRDFILERLKRHYGSNKWWKQGVSGTLKKKADEKWTAEVKRKPNLKDEKEQNERKFGYFDLAQSKEIVFYRDNWEQVFEPIFIDKSNFERRINDITVLRNPISHKRKMDDQDVIDGIGGLLWLSKCINDQILNPYAEKVI